MDSDINLFERYKDKITEEFEKKSSVGEYQEKLDKLRDCLKDPKNIKVGLKKVIDEDLIDYDFTFLKHLYDETIVTIAYSKEKHSSLDDRDYERLELEVLLRNDSPILKLDKDFKFQHIKEIIRRLHEQYGVRPFLISKSHKINGRVAYQLYESAKRISLVQEYVDMKDSSKSRLCFIGEPQPRQAPDEETSRLFYLHHFEDDQKEQYLLIHDERIRPQECIVEGMIVSLPEDLKIGESISLGGSKKLIIVNKIQLTEEPLTQEEIRQYTQDWNTETLFSKVFGLYRHPSIYEWIHCAWMLSGKYSGYPLHLLIFGPNASGKTTGIIQPTTCVIPDPRPRVFIDGAGTTIRGLMPSYSGSKLSPGLFIGSNRICYVDEFLKTIIRSPKNSRGEQTGLESFTSVLEHRAGIVASGNTEPTNLVATAKALFTTNPERGLEDLVECNKNLSIPAMARFLTYMQTPEHVDYITNNMAKVCSIPFEETLPKYDPKFIGIYDFFNEKAAVPDFKELMRIRNDLAKIVPEGLGEMFRGRYLHHLALIVDGVSNIRWLCNEKQSLEYDEGDYKKAEAIMYYIINSWKQRIDFKEIPHYLWQEYLSVEERDLYEIIKKHDNQLMEKDIGNTEMLKKLFDIGIVIEKNGYLLTHTNPEVWTTSSLLDF